MVRCGMCVPPERATGGLRGEQAARLLVSTARRDKLEKRDPHEGIFLPMGLPANTDTQIPGQNRWKVRLGEPPRPAGQRPALPGSPEVKRNAQPWPEKAKKIGAGEGVRTLDILVGNEM